MEVIAIDVQRWPTIVMERADDFAVAQRLADQRRQWDVREFGLTIAETAGFAVIAFRTCGMRAWPLSFGSFSGATSGMPVFSMGWALNFGGCGISFRRRRRLGASRVGQALADQRQAFGPIRQRRHQREKLIGASRSLPALRAHSFIMHVQRDRVSGCFETCQCERQQITGDTSDDVLYEDAEPAALIVPTSFGVVLVNDIQFAKLARFEMSFGVGEASAAWQDQIKVAIAIVGSETIFKVTRCLVRNARRSMPSSACQKASVRECCARHLALKVST